MEKSHATSDKYIELTAYLMTYDTYNLLNIISYLQAEITENEHLMKDVKRNLKVLNLYCMCLKGIISS